MRYRWILIAWLPLAACDHADTTSSTNVTIDDAASDGCTAAHAGIPPLRACTHDSDCLPGALPGAPRGTLHVVCFEGVCNNADHCVTTHAGALDYCACGADNGCHGNQVCSTPPNGSIATCSETCSGP